MRKVVDFPFLIEKLYSMESLFGNNRGDFSRNSNQMLRILSKFLSESTTRSKNAETEPRCFFPIIKIYNFF
jgi:hypothetical protein